MEDSESDEIDSIDIKSRLRMSARMIPEWIDRLIEDIRRQEIGEAI